MSKRHVRNLSRAEILRRARASTPFDGRVSEDDAGKHLVVAPDTPAALILSDGRVFEGTAFGAGGTCFGEVVFNTAMTGYQEVITDPSYRGQIVTMTYPHIGNYGVHHEDTESDGPQLAALVIRKLARRPSHDQAAGALEAYMVEHGIMGIEGIDTRALVRHVRRFGAVPGMLTTEYDAPLTAGNAARLAACAGAWSRQVDWGLAKRAGTSSVQVIEANGSYRGALPEPPTVVAFDFGMKRSIIACLLSFGARLLIVPPSTRAEEILAREPDGIFLSNGPGDPTALDEEVRQVSKLIGEAPLFGICLGHQIVAQALGMGIQKMRFGHHGANHPVVDLETGEVCITSQNHNYAVARGALPAGVEISHISLFDQSVEGLRVPERDCFSVQYHPEASPGPHDARGHFETFFALIERRRLDRR